MYSDETEMDHTWLLVVLCWSFVYRVECTGLQGWLKLHPKGRVPLCKQLRVLRPASLAFVQVMVVTQEQKDSTIGIGIDASAVLELSHRPKLSPGPHPVASRHTNRSNNSNYKVTLQVWGFKQIPSCLPDRP